MHRPDRARLAVLLAAASMVLLGVAFVWLHLTTPSDGARLEPGQPVWRLDGVVVTPLREQPGVLHAGDVVVAVDGRSLESWAQALLDPMAHRPTWRFGQRVTYTVVREGTQMDVPVTLGEHPLDAIWRDDWSTILFALVFELIALYIVLRRPTERAPLVLLLSASGVLSSTTWSFGLQVSDLVGGAGFWLYKATSFVAFMLFYIGGLHFALIFPRPHASIARRAWLIRALYVAPYVVYLGYLAVMGRAARSVLDWLGRWIPGESALAVILLAATVAAVIWGYRAHRDPETQAKVRWIVFGALICGIAGLVLWNIPAAVLGRPLISTNALGLLVLPFPLTIAIAILRHRLFDIDTLLNRTLVYVGLTGTVVGIYVLIVGLLGTLLQTRFNLAISLVATGVVAVLFQPLRVGLQRVVGRLLFGERDNPYAVLSRLGRRLEATLAPQAVLPTIVETVAQALKLPSVAIAVEDGEDGEQVRSAVTYGVPVSAPVDFPLMYRGELVGHLRVSPRAPDEPFTAADTRLLEDVAHQAGIAVHATRLTADLQRSRERLVMAREEERRRLRRDLHDGLGPTLAGLTLKIGAIRNLVSRDPAVSDRLLAELSAEIEAASADIRRLAYGLRPPALDELGLLAALRAHAAQYESQGGEVTGLSAAPRMRVTVDAPEHLPALPAAVEVAAYRIACEALTNAARHAAARTCHLRIALADGLWVEIADDGTGLSSERRSGIGLLSMRERAEELGGTCEVASGPSGGTWVVAHLPIVRQ